MMKTKSPEESDSNRVEDSIRRAYLGGWKSLAWIVGIIRSSMFSGENLRAILDQVEQESNLDETKKQKMSELRTELKNKGLL
jgi:hypothetical protein